MIAEILQPYVDRQMLPGAVTAVGDSDKIYALETVGFADVASGRPMQADTVFWIASMTKPMTATAFMMLVDEGKVSVRDLVSDYIPEFANVMVAPPKGQDGSLEKPNHPLQIWELLCHVGGLPFSVPEEPQPYDRFSLAERVQFYPRNPLVHQPGTAYLYSNADVHTIGRIIEIVASTPYAKFLDDRLLKPLGMTDTTFWPNAEQISRIATAYKLGPDGETLGPTGISQISGPYDDPARHPLPAGGLFSTAADIMKFMQMIANGGVANRQRLISEAAIAEMHHKHSDPSISEPHGYCWRVEPTRIGHGGAYRTSMFLNPQTGIISVFLVHQDGPWPKGGDEVIEQSFNDAVLRLSAR